MSLGCPVITVDVPGAQEQYGDAALYFFPTKEQELAERVKQLLESKEVRQGLVARGRRAARWTVEDYAKRVVSVLDEFAEIARCWERCDSSFT
jgi:glycosyltransferase involved in cell wall biosynthesis